MPTDRRLDCTFVGRGGDPASLGDCDVIENDGLEDGEVAGK